MAPTPQDMTVRVATEAVTSGMTPHGTSREHAPQGLVVTAAYGHEDTSIRCRGQLLIEPGVVSFSPFEPPEGAVEVSQAVTSIAITRGWAPWTGDRFQLEGRTRVRVTVPRHSRRKLRRLLSAAGIQLRDQT
jgi:hypothetical protein